MSVYGALFAGVSGLEAQSNTLSVISNNIANVNTVGYKSASGLFESLVTSSAGAAFSPGGVIGNTVQNVSLQGQLQSTSSPTDIAIQGNGFFVVNQTSDGSGQVLYTRAGNFTQDSTGNFRNAAGYYLQAWPLDRDGNLPGAPGNTTDTTSSANLSSLQTVNVNNLTGSASSTTTVSVGANLNSSQAAYLGSGKVATIDNTDGANFGSTGLNATGLIVPTPGAADKLTAGDKFTVSTSDNTTGTTFTYGGFATSNDVGGTAPTDVSNVTAANTSPAFTFVSSNSTTTTIAVNSTALPTVNGGGSLAVGDTVTFAGVSSNFDGVDMNGSFIVASVNNPSSGNYTIVANTVATTDPVTFTTPAGSAPQTVTVNDANVSAANLAVGDTVTLNITGAPGGLANGATTVTVTGVSTGSFTYATASPTTTTLATAAGTGSTAQVLAGGHATSGHITQNTRPFDGGILNAGAVTETFLGATPTSDFTSAALSFNVTNSTGSSTFTYTAGTPNPSLGQFNTLDNLAAAINDSSNGFTARVVSGKLYVGSIDASDKTLFSNGSTTGISGPPLQSGIDWVSELGLSNVAAASPGTTHFSNLQGLANSINAINGLTATITNASGAASLAIDTSDPTATITFSDDSSNTGDPLAELGINTPLNGGTLVPSFTTGPIAAAYQAGVSGKNMASGAITPQFSRPVQVFDSLGTPHNLNIGFIKTGTNTWGVEIYAEPASDTTATDGQIASGTLTFNGDGTLENVSGGLASAANINWTDGAQASNVTFSWGTQGPIGTGKSDGLSQFDSAYNVNFVNQNGVPVGDLTSVAIDADGYITASYSNGETQKLFKIPLAEFTDPNSLNPLSNNVFAQSEASGVVNLSQAGTSSAGTIASSSLEASNVELADQLTTMIIAQRSYEANTKVISTADTLLQDLNQIIQ